jgi:natural product biosynthesis luciferase-like monooxygenase protein
MELGLMFFSGEVVADPTDRYSLFLQASTFADQHGYSAVWTPERHFHTFGGLFPNPAITSAALATVTTRVSIRAGSLVAPLHDPIRIVEDWAVIDNLSHGRVGISFGTGWNANDFVFFPENYPTRYEETVRVIDQVARLWRGAHLPRVNGNGQEVATRPLPPPIQASLPMWVTASTRVETFQLAGRLGLNVLTQFGNQDLPALKAKVDAYRDARQGAGHDPDTGVVTVMLHTLVCRDRDTARGLARGPMHEYLRRSMALEVDSAASAGDASGRVGLEHRMVDELLDRAFERYFDGASLLGTVADCRGVLTRLEQVGVSEVACLVDFGPPADAVMESLELLSELNGG